MTDVLDVLQRALGDRYAFERPIGRGGMATVYLARDRKHDRQVAVKVMHPQLAASLGSQRFLQEIAIAARIAHPHIVPLFDSGQCDGLLYYVMPYIAGDSLRGLMRRAPADLDTAVRITRQAADALDHAHQLGVVHRDIKPENILLAGDHAYVADFGVAKAVHAAGGQALTRTGFPLGTPGYMSPEQAAGLRDLDARTDVFGLACVCYELLVGEPPGLWVTDEAVRVGRFLDAEPEHRRALDGLPGRVEQVLCRALALRREHRFETPGAFAAALATAASEQRLRLSDAQRERVLQRAAQLELQHVTMDDALSIGAVEQIAAEVGIPPEHVRQALAELDGPPTPAPPVSVAAPAPGVPAPWPEPGVPAAGRLEVRRHAAREIGDRDFGAVLDDIRARFGPGEVRLVGAALHWHSAHPTRRIRITLAPTDGGTDIRAEEFIAQLPGRIVVGFGGAVVGLLVGLSFAVGIAAPDLGPALGLAFAGASGYLVSRSVGVQALMSRERELTDAADHLVGLLEDAAAPPRRPLPVTPS